MAPHSSPSTPTGLWAAPSAGGEYLTTCLVWPFPVKPIDGVCCGCCTCIPAILLGQFKWLLGLRNVGRGPSRLHESFVAEAFCCGAALRCMLESRGYIVCTVPFYEWTALEGIEQQKAYMARVLAASLQRGGL